MRAGCGSAQQLYMASMWVARRCHGGALHLPPMEFSEEVVDMSPRLAGQWSIGPTPVRHDMSVVLGGRCLAKSSLCCGDAHDNPLTG